MTLMYHDHSNLYHSSSVLVIKADIKQNHFISMCMAMSVVMSVVMYQMDLKSYYSHDQISVVIYIAALRRNSYTLKFK